MWQKEVNQSEKTKKMINSGELNSIAFFENYQDSIKKMKEMF